MEPDRFWLGKSRQCKALLWDRFNGPGFAWPPKHTTGEAINAHSTSGRDMEFFSGGRMQQLNIRPLSLTIEDSTEFDPELSAISSEPPFHRLMRKNETYLAHFDRNPLFALVNSPVFQQEAVRNRFLDCLQVWSDKYQKMVLARSVFCESPRFASLTGQHLREEFGHNTDLQSMRAERPAVWDPILEATANWFPWKIMTLSETEKIVLVHTVVEASATIFYKHVRPAINAAEDPHFETHSVLDHDHQNMGLHELRHLRSEEYSRLEQIQAEGWAMLDAVMARIAQLTQEVCTVN